MTDIDKIFKDKLKNLSEPPSPEVWSDIQNRLKKPRGERSIAYYMAAASIALLLVASVYLIQNEKNDTYSDNKQAASKKQESNTAETLPQEKTYDVLTHHNSSPENEITASVLKSKSTTHIEDKFPNIQSKNSTTLASANTQRTLLVQENKTTSHTINKEPIKTKTVKDTESANSLFTSTGKTKEHKHPVSNVVLQKKKDITKEETIASKHTSPEKENPEQNSVKPFQTNTNNLYEKDLDNKNDINSLDGVQIAMNQEAKRKIKWSVSGGVIPSYSYRTTSSNSSTRTASTTNDSEGIWSVGGTVKVSVEPLKRLHIETGVAYYRFGQDSDIELEGTVSADASQARFGKIETEIGSLTNKADFVPETPSDSPIFSNFSSRENVSRNVEVNQEFDNLEIPLVLGYELIDADVSVSVLGGVSANFIVDNNAYVDGEDVGETSDINTTNFSTNLGIGVEYDLNSKLKLQVQPSFKYYLNSISENPNIDYTPYVFTITTGIKIDL